MKRTIVTVLALSSLNVFAASNGTLAAGDLGECKLTLHESAPGTVEFPWEHRKELIETVTFEACLENARADLKKTWTQRVCLDWRRGGFNGDLHCVEPDDLPVRIKKVDYKFLSKTEKITGSITDRN